MVRILESLKYLIIPPRKIYGIDALREKINVEKKVVVLTTRHCLFIAELLVEALKGIGISSNIILKKPKLGFNNLLHIVICPQVFKHLPVNYIAFQMEQSESSSWFTADYFRKLNDALAVFDYSLTNVEYLKKNLLNPNKVFYLPIAINKAYIGNFNTDLVTRKYDIVFYGDDQSQRRKKILNVLKSKYRVKIITGVFGAKLYEELSDAKIVVNVHYYENALLETTRLYEVLSLNNNVIISECGRDQEQHKFLEEMVDFINDGDVYALTQKIDYYLDNNELIEKKLIENKKALNKIEFTEFENRLNKIFCDNDGKS